MTRLSPYCLAAGGVLVMATMLGCQQQDASQSKVSTSATATVPAVASTLANKPVTETFRRNPNFGGVATQHVEVTATGDTLEGAVDNAIRLAVEQVNGKRVNAASYHLDAGAHVTADGESAKVDSSAYANWVASATSGAVSHFQLLSQKQINQPKSTDEESLKASQGASWNRGNVDASASDSENASAKVDSASADASANSSESLKGSWDKQQGASQVDYQGKHTDYTSQWEVRIGADVATYQQSPAAKLTRVVVAMPRVKDSTFRVGDNAIPADSIASAIRSKVSEALTQTHRFTVLDRDANDEINQEIGLINSGNATNADTARLGQQLATDLIVIPTIDRFEYLRHERALRMADRSLVTYSGGGEISFRVVNAVTGQIVMSQSFNYAFPSTEPTTLGVSVDGNELASEMMSSVDRSIVSAILQSTYPLSILQLQGRNVIVNQGGEAVQQGGTYQAVTLGKALVDPQSGQSLGPTESPCCTVTIDRVTPNLSYGHIVEDNVHIDTPFSPGSMELRGQVASALTHSSSENASVVRHTPHKDAPAQASKTADNPNW
jgi:hypothetical protein